MYNLLTQLTALHGPSGYEQPVSHFIKEYIADIVDEVYIDRIGNVIAKKKGNGKKGPKVIVTAHMDEVGFIVKKIESNGFIRFEKLGGHDDRILLSQKVLVRTAEGTVSGVIGTMSAHYVKFDDSSKVRKHQQLYIDIGASSKEEVLSLGVKIGSPITYATPLSYLGNEKTGKVVGKSLDNRVGCAVIIKALENLCSSDFAGELICLFTVQEEVGLRGASAAAVGLDADVAIALDTTAVSDTNEETMDNSLLLGGGVGIKVMDFSLIAHPSVKEYIERIAEEKSLSYQLEVFPGIGTDGGALALSNQGIPTGVLSIPSRYAHAPYEVIDLNDVNATLELLLGFLKSLDEHSVFSF
ncbi:M42 family peptidase [Bacillus sp. HMF5848]|uniref:M42 family metallopeptidase n=1 Tax=Bacillus sp. HMF5848 TaxID=2495421 RepID=UPI000F76A913|nr:M42 family metallopeptidase [Bacillus sp. HMF5848]RSK27248.1 M42 family peptidase [Bacillus sp. HMF5848]